MDAMSLVSVALGGAMLGTAGGWLLARRRAALAQAVAPQVAPPEVIATPEPATQHSPSPEPANTDAAHCDVPHCALPAQLRGLCRKHYGKAYRLGFLEELTQERLERLSVDRRRHPRARPSMLRVVETR